MTKPPEPRRPGAVNFRPEAAQQPDGPLGRRNMLVYGFASSKNNKNDGMKRGIRRERNSMRSGMTRRTAIKTAALATTALIAAPYVRGAHAAGKLSIGYWDHWVPGRQQDLRGDHPRMGREGKGRSHDRLHPVAGRQEPDDHRGGSAGALGPRRSGVPDLVAAGLCQEPGAGERHHGAADQAERRGERHRDLSRQGRRQLAWRCRRRSARRSRARARAST